MPYATGTAADVNDLATKFKDFLLANGWTVNRFDTGAEAACLKGKLVETVISDEAGEIVGRSENELAHRVLETGIDGREVCYGFTEAVDQHVLERHDSGCVAWLRPQEPQLAELVRGRHEPDTDLVTVGRLDADRDRAAPQEEEAVAQVALVEDHFACVELPRPSSSQQCIARLAGDERVERLGHAFSTAPMERGTPGFPTDGLVARRTAVVRNARLTGSPASRSRPDLS